MCSKPVKGRHGTGYHAKATYKTTDSIQHYVIKCVSDLQQVGGFLRVLRFLPQIKLTAKI
jgi:hypothetical protein